MCCRAPRRSVIHRIALTGKPKDSGGPEAPLYTNTSSPDRVLIALRKEKETLVSGAISDNYTSVQVLEVRRNSGWKADHGITLLVRRHLRSP